MATATVEPNAYDLESKDNHVHVRYLVRGERSRTLAYRDDTIERTYQDGDIRVADVTDLGAVVTILLEAAPDHHWTTFSLIIPRVQLNERVSSAPISAKGIKTVHTTSLAPQTLLGQLDTYQLVAALEGTAASVKTSDSSGHLIVAI